MTASPSGSVAVSVNWSGRCSTVKSGGSDEKIGAWSVGVTVTAIVSVLLAAPSDTVSVTPVYMPAEK